MQNRARPPRHIGSLHQSRQCLHVARQAAAAVDDVQSAFTDRRCRGRRDDQQRLGLVRLGAQLREAHARDDDECGDDQREQPAVAHDGGECRQPAGRPTGQDPRRTLLLGAPAGRPTRTHLHQTSLHLHPPYATPRELAESAGSGEFSRRRRSLKTASRWSCGSGSSRAASAIRASGAHGRRAPTRPAWRGGGRGSSRPARTTRPARPSAASRARSRGRRGPSGRTRRPGGCT